MGSSIDTAARDLASPHTSTYTHTKGGMRGCVGAGMLAALNHLGLRDAFDVVYGSSAGSLMGAYFLSGQTPLEGPGVSRCVCVCASIVVVGV